MRRMRDCKNIVQCDDVNYVKHDDGLGWDVFIKMELLTPLVKSLPEVIPEETVRKLAEDLCAALIECKKHNVIHRDIKPQNIFISNNGDYKLGDFGIAKTVEKTMGGTKIGTYHYMAPEVHNNQPYGTAADIYSLGLVLYWMLNDRRMPFLPPSPAMITGSMDAEARMRRLSGEKLPAPLRGSDALRAVVLKACFYHPSDRYQSPQEMLSAIQNITSAASKCDQEARGVKVVVDISPGVITMQIPIVAIGMIIPLLVLGVWCDKRENVINSAKSILEKRRGGTK